jgi:nickel-dependent lactate racemase
MIGHPKSTFGETDGNPIWEEMLEVASLTTPTFVLNVTLTEDRCITGVFSGDLEEAHRVGADFVRRSAMVPIEEAFDIVVTTAGGYPLDINLYQAVKGIAVAGGIVKDGGAIVLVSECSEGLPEYGEYGELMRKADTPARLLEMIHQPGFAMQDQWDAQIQAGICERAEVYIYADGLTDDEIGQALGRPCRSIEETLSGLLRQYGPDARIAVLPAGPLTVPFIDN